MRCSGWQSSLARWGIGGIVSALFGAGVALTVEALAVARLPGETEALPVRVYARPPILVLGQEGDAATVAAHLVGLGYAEVAGETVRRGEFVMTRREWLIVTRELTRLGPLATGATIRVRLDGWGRISALEDGGGTRYRAVPLEPMSLGVVSAPNGRDRTPVRLRDLPGHLIDALLTIEDRRFYEHRGLDFRRIAAAALANLRDGRVVQGGSTITQQLAKNLFLDSRRTLVRKAREAAMALLLETRHSKAEILEAYLNDVYLGQDGGLGIHGVGRAAEWLFGKDAARLDLAESAMLVGMIRGPNLYSPSRSPVAARQRRNLVLDQMLERGVITDAQHLEATSAPSAARPNVSEPPPSRFFLDYVRETLEAEPKSYGPRNGGQIVISTLDADLQRAASDAISGGLAALERDHPGIAERGTASGSPVQAALVAVDPRTGDVLAMVGGRDYGESQFNRAVHARRQPGSSFKPIVTLAALSRSDQKDRGGRPFTLATVLSDQPLEVETPAGPWQPVNYDGRFHGRVSLREALERSLNVPFARLGLEIGPERIVETARKVGIESPVKPYPSIALGAFEVTPLEMARAYGVLATGGYRADSRSVLGILDPDGKVVTVREASTRPVASPAETYLVTSALRGAVVRGTGRSLLALGFDGVVAAKSGTTNGFRDGWFIGYTPTLAVAVWVGFDDGQSLGLSGSRVALPIFARFMTAATGRYGDHGPWGSSGFIRPAGLEVVDVDPATGLRAGPGCSGRPELFLSGTAPVGSCSPYGYRRNASTVQRNELLQLLRQRARGRER